MQTVQRIRRCEADLHSATSESVWACSDRIAPRRSDSELSPAPSASVDDPVFATKALRKFLTSLTSRESPVLLDLGPVVGSNVSFFGEQLGCKIFVEDIYADLDRHVRDGKVEELPAFLEKRFPQADGAVDGILCWDMIDYLDRRAAQALAEQLTRVLRPDGALLGFFGTAQPRDTPLHEIHHRRRGQPEAPHVSRGTRAAGDPAQSRHHPAVLRTARVGFVPPEEQPARDPVPQARSQHYAEACPLQARHDVPRFDSAEVDGPRSLASDAQRRRAETLLARASPLGQVARLAMSRPVIALLTDFGLRDHYAGTMKGVALGICPDATLVDISHEMAPQRRPCRRARAGRRVPLLSRRDHFSGRRRSGRRLVAPRARRRSGRLPVRRAGQRRAVGRLRRDRRPLAVVELTERPVRAADRQPHVRRTRSICAGGGLAGDRHRADGARPSRRRGASARGARGRATLPRASRAKCCASIASAI